MGNIVKVLSFPSNFRIGGTLSPFELRDASRDIQLEEESGQVRRLPEISCAHQLRVGKWYEMYLISAVHFPRYGFHYLRERNEPESATISAEGAPQTVTSEVTIKEVPARENDDTFLVSFPNGSQRRISVSVSHGYLATDSRATLAIRKRGTVEEIESLRPVGKTIAPFPIEPGTVRHTAKQVEVFSGYRWMNLSEALTESLVNLDAVGQLVRSVKICDGAIGSPSQYTIYVHLWKVGGTYVIDATEEGDGFECFSSKKLAESRIREMRRVEQSTDSEI